MLPCSRKKYMRTQAQIEASRKNGSKSNGPKSEAGKARSSQNSLKHGFFSVKTVVLDGENKQEWEVYQQAWFARLKPCDFIEERLVLEIAVNQWRLERAWNLRTALIDQETSNQLEIIPKEYDQYDASLILACSHAVRKDDLLALDQQETRLSRNTDRAYRKLNDIRAQYPIEPVLENELEPEPECIESENEPEPSVKKEDAAIETEEQTNAKSENEPGNS